MEIISLLGIGVGVLLFIFMMFKGFHVVISGICAALAMAVTSGGDILNIMVDSWAGGFSGYMKSMFLVFLLGSVFGSLLGDSGGAKRIAIALYKFFSTRKGDQKFYGVCFVIALYSILIYAGVSGMIIVFAVYNIAYELFRRLDIPWNLYGYGGVAGVCIFWISGSLQVANVTAAKVAGVTTMAAPVISIAATIAFYVVLLLIVKWDLRVAGKKNEGFFPTGKAIFEERGAKEGEVLDDVSGLPSLGASVLPIVVMVAAAGLGLNVVAAMLLGCVVLYLFMMKRYSNIKATITNGVTSCFGPSVGVSVTSALGTVIRVVPGFGIVTGALGVFPPLYQGILIIAIVTFVSSSSGAAISSFGADVLALFTQAGLTPEVSARLMTIAAFTGCPPHSAGVANVCALCKIDYKRALDVYFKGPLIAGFASLVVAVLLINFGVMF